jgi:serine/threonine-protein kinase
MNGDGVERDTVLSHLQRVLSSTPFRQADRSAELLRYLVERALNGAGDRVKEYTIGLEALGRGKDFDPRTDPIVRAEASRLRGRLERYYAAEGESDMVVIELPKGTYVPRFYSRSLPSPARSDQDRPHRQVRSHRRWILWGSLGGLGILGAFTAGVWSTRSPSVDRESREPATRLVVQLQSDEMIGSDVETDVVIAPDGARVVFASIDSLGLAHLRVRRFDGSAPIDLPGTAGARGPFWSPDSRWIGFWAGGQLRKIAADGGSPVVLCAAPDLLGASWSDDGTIIAALDVTKRLWRVDAAPGGKPVPVVDLTAQNAAPRWPEVLPGGKYVLYTAFTGLGVDQADIEVAPLAGGPARVLVKGGTFGRYVAPHHLTFVNQGTLYAVRFDPRSIVPRCRAEP